MAKTKNSEFRLYDFITQSLKDMGWNVKNPSRYAGGEVYCQNECLSNSVLKEALGKDRPENVIIVDENVFWVIEAKTKYEDIGKAVDEAKAYAQKINKTKNSKCKFVTGVSGDVDSTFIVETWFFKNKQWERVKINDIDLSGFLSREQTGKILANNSGSLKNEEIPDGLFLDKANKINEILHEGAIVKKNRARVIASLLLTLVQDPYFRVSSDPTTLIEDINSRVRALLRTHSKENFAQEIAISLPTSKDNHKKNRHAIALTIQELRALNISSAVNSSNDILGQFYEIFLKYANDSKEIGIVLTPRHITRFASEVLNISPQDYIYDPTCGTGGFLVAALDRVKQSIPPGKSLDSFKRSNIYGVEQEPEVVGLALVNMIFRGDGKSNIYEGNTFDNYFFKINGEIKRVKKEQYSSGIKKGIEYDRFITKTLMNPPFALKDEEFEFVEHALTQMTPGGLLFAVIPTSIMTSSSNDDKEAVWRKKMLENHKLRAVIKLSEDLFQPNAHKGTYAVIIQAWIPHRDDDVFWAIMDDGFTMVKSKRLPAKNVPSNIEIIEKELKIFLLSGQTPKPVEKILATTKINFSNKVLDLSPEHHLPFNAAKDVDFGSPIRSLLSHLLNSQPNHRRDVSDVKHVRVSDMIRDMSKGDCRPLNQLLPGIIPVITTSENNNGVAGFYETNATMHINTVTIPANGSKYKAFFHPYSFCATQDVLVCDFADEYRHLEVMLYFCSLYNQNSWRFSFFRKCTESKVMEDISIPIPMTKGGKVDLKAIGKLFENMPEYHQLKEIFNNEQAKK